MNWGCNHHICHHFFNHDSGTYSDIDGHRQPSQVELDIAKHQATCVGCSLATARPLTLFLVTSLVSPVPWPWAALLETLPLLRPGLVAGGVPQAQVVLCSETSASYAPLLNKCTGERAKNTQKWFYKTAPLQVIHNSDCPWYRVHVYIKCTLYTPSPSPDPIAQHRVRACVSACACVRACARVRACACARACVSWRC